MRSITAGSSIAAMIFRLPPHRGQRSISMSNTRFSNRARAAASRGQGRSGQAGPGRGGHESAGVRHSHAERDAWIRASHQGAESQDELWGRSANQSSGEPPACKTVLRRREAVGTALATRERAMPAGTTTGAPSPASGATSARAVTRSACFHEASAARRGCKPSPLRAAAAGLNFLSLA